MGAGQQGAGAAEGDHQQPRGLRVRTTELQLPNAQLPDRPILGVGPWDLGVDDISPPSQLRDLRSHRQRRSSRSVAVIAVAGHYSGRARTGADRSANRRTLCATQNASMMAPPIAPPPIFAALTTGRIAFAIDRLGVQRQSRSIRKDDRRELDAKTCALAHLAAALDHRHFTKRLRARRNRDAITDLTSRVTRATTLSSTCASRW